MEKQQLRTYALVAYAVLFVVAVTSYVAYQQGRKSILDAAMQSARESSGR